MMKRALKLMGDLMIALLLVALCSAVLPEKVSGEGEPKALQPQSSQDGPTRMSVEEKLIRDVYARLMRYQSAGLDQRAAESGEPAQPASYVTFELRNVHSGPISEIDQKPLSELVTEQKGDIIQIKPTRLSNFGGPQHAYYDAEWVTSASTSQRVQGSAGFENFNRYTSYQVTVSFNGKQRSYRAMAVYRLDDPNTPSRPRSTNVNILDNITIDMNVVYGDESPRVRSPWSKYVKTSLYRAIAKSIKAKTDAEQLLRPEDAPIGYLPGDDVESSFNEMPMLAPIDGGGGGDDGGGGGGGGGEPDPCQALTVVDVTAAGATKVTSVSGNANIIHFVTPKGGATDQVTLTAVINPDTTANRARISWQGATMSTSNRLQATVSKSSASKNVVKVLIDGTAAKETRVWVVWATLSGGVAAPTVTALNTSGGLRNGTQIGASFSSTAAIAPSTIITDADRPNLSGANTVAPPGTNNVAGQPLSGGVNAKWDMSRRVTIRSSNNATAPALPAVAVDGNDCYPTNLVIGNDDAGTGDENNNPYPTSAQLTSLDVPTRTWGMQGGVVGNTYRTQLWFQEFARLEIQGTWFVISDPQSWRVDIRFIKVQVTEALWHWDVNGDGDMNDDVTETMLGADMNGDGDTNDNVGYWDNDSSAAANDNAGRPAC